MSSSLTPAPSPLPGTSPLHPSALTAVLIGALRVRRRPRAWSAQRPSALRAHHVGLTAAAPVAVRLAHDETGWARGRLKDVTLGGRVAPTGTAHPIHTRRHPHVAVRVLHSPLLFLFPASISITWPLIARRHAVRPIQPQLLECPSRTRSMRTTFLVPHRHSNRPYSFVPRVNLGGSQRHMSSQRPRRSPGLTTTSRADIGRGTGRTRTSRTRARRDGRAPSRSGASTQPPFHFELDSRPCARRRHDAGDDEARGPRGGETSQGAHPRTIAESSRAISTTTGSGGGSTRGVS